MALILDSLKIRIEKDSGDNLKVIACIVKKSSDSEDLKSYYEKELTVSSGDASSLSSILDILEAQVKSEENLS